MRLDAISFFCWKLTVLAVALSACALTMAQDRQPAPQDSQTVNPAQSAPDPQGASEPTAQPPAQSTNTDDTGRFVFKKDVDEVVLHATVTDEQGHLVTSLDGSAFSIFQNGAPQAITSFHRDDVPVAMGIVVDNSGSMRDKRDKVNQAVVNLIQASNPQDQIFVVNFSENSYLDQDFTSDVGLLQAALHQISARGSTAVYDAVVASAAHLRSNASLDKKVLVVITDGQDNMSRETLQETTRRLHREGGPAIYAIGLKEKGWTREGREALQSLAVTTGGAAFFPQSLDDVQAITRAIAHDIRSQYTLVYKPDSLGSRTGYQVIRVEAKAPGHGRLIVRTRTGYYPGETVR